MENCIQRIPAGVVRPYVELTKEIPIPPKKTRLAKVRIKKVNNVHVLLHSKVLSK